MNAITELKKGLVYTNPRPDTGKISGALSVLLGELEKDLIDVRYDPSEQTLSAIKDLRQEIADFESLELTKQIAQQELEEEETDEEEEDDSWKLPPEGTEE